MASGHVTPDGDDCSLSLIPVRRSQNLLGMMLFAGDNILLGMVFPFIPSPFCISKISGGYFAEDEFSFLPFPFCVVRPPRSLVDIRSEYSGDRLGTWLTISSTCFFFPALPRTFLAILGQYYSAWQPTSFVLLPCLWPALFTFYVVPFWQLVVSSERPSLKHKFLEKFF